MDCTSKIRIPATPPSVTETFQRRSGTSALNTHDVHTRSIYHVLVPSSTQVPVQKSHPPRGLLPSALHHALSLPCLTSAHPTRQYQLFCCIINITYLYVKSLIVFFCWNTSSVKGGTRRAHSSLMGMRLQRCPEQGLPLGGRDRGGLCLPWENSIACGEYYTAMKKAWT